jgi:hypothetical protein
MWTRLIVICIPLRKENTQLKRAGGGAEKAFASGSSFWASSFAFYFSLIRSYFRFCRSARVSARSFLRADFASASFSFLALFSRSSSR